MRITELLDKRSISLDAAPKSKNETLDMAVELMAASGKIKDKEAYKKLVYAREEESTTGVGEGIAIPHGKGDCVDQPGLAAMVIKDGVDYEALDDEPVNILFLIAAPDTEDNVHLDVLSKLSMMLMDEDFRKNLINAKDADEFLSIIDKADEERGSVDESLAETSIADDNSGSLKVVAVTSCPTGIAHTYMAAEGLEKAAEKAGIKIKIETRGSSGAKNMLTDEDIAAADCVVVTADAKVPMDRFKGKKLIQRKVADGINKADEIMGIVNYTENLLIPAYIDKKPVYSVGKEAFDQMTFETITFEEGVREIGVFSFHKVKGVKELVIPKSVEGMSLYSFSSSEWEKVTFLGNVSSAFSSFEGCDQLKEIVFPSCFKYIDFRCFWCSDGLEELFFPEGMEWIGMQAFNNCPNLKTIHLPKSIKMISDNAFYRCPNLKTVYYNGNKEDSDKISINNEEEGNQKLIDANWIYNE